MKGYSEIKMSFRCGSGHFTSYSNVNMRAKAFLSPKLELTVGTTLFMEPLMRCFDIILPACTDLERNDILRALVRYSIKRDEARDPVEVTEQ